MILIYLLLKTFILLRYNVTRQVSNLKYKNIIKLFIKPKQFNASQININLILTQI